MASHKRSPSTLSEGEIIESGSETKATASQPPLNGTSVVDRPTRASTSSAPRSRSPASLRDSRSPRGQWSQTRSRSRTRSPYRDCKGYKRRREDDYDAHESRRSRHEPPRRFGSRYDDRHHDRGASYRRPRPYYDYDREESYSGGLRYSDDYDRRRDKRPRTRSRSPYREMRKPKQYSGDEMDLKADGPGTQKRRSSTEQSVTARGKTGVAQDAKLGTETRDGQVQQASHMQARVADEYVFRSLPGRLYDSHVDRADTSTAVDSGEDLQPSEPVDEAAALEARRKRREAIRAKYRGQATPLRLKALPVETDASTPSTEMASAQGISGGFPRLSEVFSGKLTSLSNV